MNSELAKIFIDLGKITPKNAWIWTWWDYGYAIQYYSHRATFHDGGSQGTPKTYFVALSFTTSSPQVGFNVTKSVAVCGYKCIKKLLEEGKTAKQIYKLFISGKLLKGKKINHPIYWLFTGDEIGKFAWISYFGTWNFDNDKGYHHYILPGLCQTLNNTYGIYVCGVNGLGRFLLDLTDSNNPFIRYPNNKTLPLKVFAIRTPKNIEYFVNKYSSYGLAGEKVYTDFKYKNNYIYNWYFTDLAAFNSNFNKMFILRVWNKKLFKKEYEKFPIAVLYRLK
jgi:dolichyl-diphosphooligosaccharide--protein glycosyltransferase